MAELSASADEDIAKPSPACGRGLGEGLLLKILPGTGRGTAAGGGGGGRPGATRVAVLFSKLSP